MNGSTVLGEYVYNGKGQRADKRIPSQNKCTVFHYDQNGLLITESTRTGNIKAEYVYLNGSPLAKIENNNVYYYHDDHLGTPILMTDSSGSVVWSGEFLPFGEPLSITGSVTNNLRFPGQYYDSETGLHQNWHRDYKTEIGRYPQADPIGLAGGINLYSYVKNRPTMLIDPLGLDSLRYHVNALFPYLEWLNDSGFPIGIYPAYSGTRLGKYKPLPYGTYTGKNLRTRTEKGMRCGKQGWSLDIEPSNFSTNRTLLRIHPDEPPFGTKGCIGVDCNYAAGALYNQLLNYFNSDHSEISIEVTY